MSSYIPTLEEEENHVKFLLTYTFLGIFLLTVHDKVPGSTWLCS